MTKSHLMLHLHSPSLSPLYSSPFYIPFSTSPFYTPLISSFYNLPLHPFLQLVQLNRRWAPHWSQDKPPIWLTPLYHFLYTSSLHPFSTSLLYTPTLPHIYPYLHIYIYPPHASPPFDTPSLHFYSSTLHSLSVLPIYPPLYPPTLQPLSRTHSPNGYKSTPPYD